MSHIVYGLQVWGIHGSKSILRKVQGIQTNTLKWVTSNHTGGLKDLLAVTKWLSVYQLSIYHSVLLWWKVSKNKNPVRLLERTLKVQETVARLLLTERIWSRKSEYYYRMVEPLLNRNQRIATVKRILNEWIKSNIPIFEE